MYETKNSWKTSQFTTQVSCSRNTIKALHSRINHHPTSASQPITPHSYGEVLLQLPVQEVLQNVVRFPLKRVTLPSYPGPLLSVTQRIYQGTASCCVYVGALNARRTDRARGLHPRIITHVVTCRVETPMIRVQSSYRVLKVGVPSVVCTVRRRGGSEGLIHGVWFRFEVIRRVVRVMRVSVTQVWSLWSRSGVEGG